MAKIKIKDLTGKEIISDEELKSISGGAVTTIPAYKLPYGGGSCGTCPACGCYFGSDQYTKHHGIENLVWMMTPPSPTQ
jgi:bacteriocin-like protein